MRVLIEVLAVRLLKGSYRLLVLPFAVFTEEWLWRRGWLRFGFLLKTAPVDELELRFLFLRLLSHPHQLFLTLPLLFLFFDFFGHQVLQSRVHTLYFLLFLSLDGFLFRFFFLALFLLPLSLPALSLCFLL